MTTALIVLLAFCCGGFVGFIAAAVLSVGKKAEDDFDGGFRTDYPPPVRTIIWGGGVDEDQR